MSAYIVTGLIGGTALAFTPLFSGWEWWQMLLFFVGLGIMKWHHHE